MEEYLPSIRVAICGEAGVGKSRLTDCLTENIPYSVMYIPTIGCNVHVAKYKSLLTHTEYVVEVFDIGGSPRYESARKIFFEDIDAVIYVWDTNIEMTYHAIDTWLEQIKSVATSDAASLGTISLSQVIEGKPFHLPLAVVGNKVDKLSLKDFETLKKTCHKHILASAKNFSNLERSQFQQFFDEVYALKRGEIVPDAFQIPIYSVQGSSPPLSTSQLIPPERFLLQRETSPVLHKRGPHKERRLPTTGTETVQILKVDSHDYDYRPEASYSDSSIGANKMA